MKFSFLKNIVSLSFGSALAQSVSVLTPLVLIKFYSPQAVGQYSFVILSASILAIFFTLRSESLLVAIDSEKDAKGISSLALRASLSLGCVAQAILLMVYFLGLWPFFPGFLFIPTAAIGIALYQISRERQIRHELYIKEAALNSSRSILNFLGQLSLGFSKFANFSGLITPKILSDFYYSISSLKRSDIIALTQAERTKLVSKYKDLCLQLFVGRLLINLSNNSISLYWPLFFSFESLGLIYMSLKITQLPGNIVGENISKVFEKSFVKGKIKQLKKVLILSFLLMLALSLAGTITIYFLLDPVISFIGNKAWANASFYSLLFSPIIFTTIISAGLASCFKLSDRVKVLNNFDLLEGLLKNLCVVAAGYLYSNNAVLMILIYSWMTLVFCLFKSAYVLLQIPETDFKAL